MSDAADDRGAARRAVRRARSTCSTALGIDTAEVRSNDRKLLFEDAGHRDHAPERRADLRRARRRRHRDHGQGRAARAARARGLRAARPRLRPLRDGRGRARAAAIAIGEALRRLGRVRIATKYPRIAARHFAATGRQAEIVEVKGSVELAPLTGLVDGIVDLTATGKTLAENDLEVVRGDRGLHRAPDRQPGGAQAEGGRRSTRLVRAACAR